MMPAGSGAYSVGHNLRALRHAAGQVRERLSQEQRNLIERLDTEFDTQCRATHVDDELATPALGEALEKASEWLSAITGAQTDRMVRDDGWRMLSIGRHIERLCSLSHALSMAVQSGTLSDDSGCEAVLALFDSTITFHAVYQQRRDLVAVLSLLLTHRDNPRSLAWVLSTLRTRLAKLPGDAERPATDLLADMPNPDSWDLIALSGALAGPAGEARSHLRLLELLQTCEAAAHAASDRLGHRYFSHADRVNRSLMT